MGRQNRMFEWDEVRDFWPDWFGAFMGRDSSLNVFGRIVLAPLTIPLGCVLFTAAICIFALETLVLKSSPPNP